jgi:hypothetical protein
MRQITTTASEQHDKPSLHTAKNPLLLSPELLLGAFSLRQQSASQSKSDLAWLFADTGSIAIVHPKAPR